MCLQFSQTERLFVYPCPNMAAPLVPFCRAIARSHPAKAPAWLWQEPCLIYKSQKDGFNIHEQSVPPQPVISETRGQCNSDTKEKLCLRAFRKKRGSEKTPLSRQDTERCGNPNPAPNYALPLPSAVQTLLGTRGRDGRTNCWRRKEQGLDSFPGSLMREWRRNLFYGLDSCLCLHHGKVEPFFHVKHQ